jgi:LytS/YehU family sensor histidine kinase
MTGEVLNKPPIKQNEEKWLNSRKLKMTIIGVAAVFLLAIIAIYAGLNKDQLSAISSFATSIAGIVGGYVVGQGYADGQATKAK